MEFVAAAPSTGTRWAEIWMDTFHCSLIQRATPPCSFPASLLAPCSCQITRSGDRARAGGGAPAVPGIPLGISRAPKCHQPAGIGEGSTLEGMRPLLQSSGWQELLSPPKTGQSTASFSIWKIEAKNHHLLRFSTSLWCPSAVGRCLLSLKPILRGRGAAAWPWDMHGLQEHRIQRMGVPGGAITTLTAQSQC